MKIDRKAAGGLDYIGLFSLLESLWDLIFLFGFTAKYLLYFSPKTPNMRHPYATFKTATKLDCLTGKFPQNLTLYNP
jgi:hypothetical protein